MAVSSKANTKFTLAAAVANAGTTVIPYPAGTTQAFLTGTTGAQLVSKSGEFKLAQGATGFTLTFGAIGTGITLTNASGAAIPAGEYFISFGEVDINGNYNLTWPKQVQDAALA